MQCLDVLDTGLDTWGVCDRAYAFVILYSPHSLYKKSQRLIAEWPDLGVDSIVSLWRAVVMLFPKQL